MHLNQAPDEDESEYEVEYFSLLMGMSMSCFLLGMRAGQEMEKTGVVRVSDERGRELMAAELVPRSVYVVAKDDWPFLATLFVIDVSTPWIDFYSGTLRMVFSAKRNPDGTLQDEMGARIRVWQWRGDPTVQ